MLRYSLMLSILAVCGAARADVEPGDWEVSVTTSVPGTPGEIGPVVRTRCLSADDARDPSRVLGPGGGCEFTNRRDDGSVYTFAIVCDGQMPMRGWPNLPSASSKRMDATSAAGRNLRTWLRC